jgi:hypothetical protein
MLALTDTDLKQTRFYQDVFAKGEEVGRQETGVVLVLRSLQRRCGELVALLREQVVRLSLCNSKSRGRRYGSLAGQQIWSRGLRRMVGTSLDWIQVPT